jgi:hypothetical protein
MSCVQLGATPKYSKKIKMYNNTTIHKECGLNKSKYLFHLSLGKHVTKWVDEFTSWNLKNQRNDNIKRLKYARCIRMKSNA